MQIDPAHIADILLADPRIDEFQIVVASEDAADPLAPGKMALRLAARSDAEGAALAAEVMETVRRACGVRPAIEFVTAAEIDGPRRRRAPRGFADLRKGAPA